MNYNSAKQIIQSESYLNEADSSIIRRKGNPIQFLGVDGNIDADGNVNVDSNVDDGSTIQRKDHFLDVLEDINLENSFNPRKVTNFGILEDVKYRRTIRRKRNFFDVLEKRNVYDHTKKGDIAYEAIGLFTKEKVDRYCMTQQNRGTEAMRKKIDKDAMSICDLYWY